MDHFQKNLRLVCSYHDSISDVSRRVGINRQQIMKYLSGASRPSARSMRRLCDFFGVEEYEIVMPHDQFRDIVRLKPEMPIGTSLAPEAVGTFLKRAARQYSQLLPYVGYFYEFRYSFTTPNMILKSLIDIHAREGLVMYKSVERLRQQETGAHVGQVDIFKYVGLFLLVGNRVHMIDQEAILGQELSHTVLYPPYRTHISLLHGMKMGVTATAAHEPVAGRVVLEKLGRAVDLRLAMRECGLYSPDSPALPSSVVSFLGPSREANLIQLKAGANW